MELNKENIKKILAIISFSIILYFVLQNIMVIFSGLRKIIHILSPFLWGAGLAFVLNIPLKMFEKRLFKPKNLKNGKIIESKLKRPVCILLSFILVILIISIVIKIVIPQLISVIVMFVQEIPSFVYDLKELAIDFTKQYPDINNQIQGININWEQVTKDVISLATNVVTGLVTSSIGFFISVMGGIFDVFITIVFAVYILSSKEKLKNQFEKIIKAYCSEKRSKYILQICSLSHNTFTNFITGQCTEAIILGVLCFFGMLLLKLPFAATIAILIGVMQLIPIVGAFIGMGIGAILILAISPIKSLVFIIFLLLLQQFEGNIIYPRVVGNSVGLPGMWVLLAVVLGGSLGGFLGLLLGLPIISILYTIFKNDVNYRLEKRKNP